jgi:hypothetical protein
MRLVHPTSLATDTPPSLASQLLQGFLVYIAFVCAADSCGSWLAGDEAGTSNITGD